MLTAPRSTVRRRKVLTAALATALLLGTAGCSTVGGEAQANNASPYLVKAKEGPLRVGFSNSFAGNAFRTQMIAELQYAADNRKNDVASLTITDANNSVDTQLSQINDLLTKGIDILLVDAASATALNGAIERAWQQGVLVVSFDNEATSEHGIVVNIDQTEFGKVGGDWLAGKVGKGESVITLDGAAGSPVNDSRLNGAMGPLKAAGILTAGQANTDWDQAKGQSAASNLLSAHPDVKGIYSQGGAASLGAINAIEQRGGKLVPITGEGYNGFLKKWKQLKDASGWQSIAPSAPPALAANALDIAIKAMRGTDPGRTPKVELPVITQDTLEKYVRPDLSDALFLPTGLPDDILNKNYK
jgi:ribose transport system substrate-binding protein